MKSTNVPYTRKSGIEITKDKPYLTQGENREKRRYKETRFLNNRKSWPILIVGTLKYFKHVQKTPDGKTILHYLAA